MNFLKTAICSVAIGVMSVGCVKVMDSAEEQPVENMNNTPSTNPGPGNGCLSRKFLGIEKWFIFGGSWGSTLGILYGIKHPSSCLGFVLRGIFLGTKDEITKWTGDIPNLDDIYSLKSYEQLENIINAWLNGDDEQTDTGTTRGSFSQQKQTSKNDDSPDAISGKYSSLDDAFADLDSL